MIIGRNSQRLKEIVGDMKDTRVFNREERRKIIEGEFNQTRLRRPLYSLLELSGVMLMPLLPIISVGIAVKYGPPWDVAGAVIAASFLPYCSWALGKAGSYKPFEAIKSVAQNQQATLQGENLSNPKDVERYDQCYLLRRVL